MITLGGRRESHRHALSSPSHHLPAPLVPYSSAVPSKALSLRADRESKMLNRTVTLSRGLFGSWLEYDTRYFSLGLQ